MRTLTWHGHRTVSDSDPLGTEDLTTHPMPLEQAPHGDEFFTHEQDGCITTVLEP